MGVTGDDGSLTGAEDDGPTVAKATLPLGCEGVRSLDFGSSSSLRAGEAALERGASKLDSMFLHSLGVSKSCADFRLASAVCSLL